MLVLRAQVGDRGAKTRLYERYGPRLWYYLRRLLREPEECEDVFQEVWLRVIRKLGTLDDPEAFRSWLYNIAHNLARSRRSRRREDLSLEDRDVPGDALATDPAHDVAEFEGYGAGDVHAALLLLPVAQRATLTLRFLEECSYEEIATIVGCTVGTVRSRLHYGKQALHDRLVQNSPAAPEAKDGTP